MCRGESGARLPIAKKATAPQVLIYDPSRIAGD